MTSAEVRDLLAAALPDVVVRVIRFQSAAEASGPAVLIRESDRDNAATLDASVRSQAGVFDLQCRAPTGPGADNLASAVIHAIDAAGRLSQILENFDDVDDPSSELGRYYAQMVVLRIA